MQTKVIILSDYAIFRKGLKLIIESHSEFNVTGEVSDPEDLFKLLKHQKPDVLVIDAVKSPKKILHIFNILNEEYPELPGVLLTEDFLEQVMVEFIKKGIHGILRKESSAEQLIEAVSNVSAGEPYLELPLSRITSKIIQHFHNKHVENYNISELSEREYEVLKLFAEGLTYKEIGNKLFISPRTVEAHKNNILKKLEIKSVTDMVKYAIKHELIVL